MFKRKLLLSTLIALSACNISCSRRDECAELFLTPFWAIIGVIMIGIVLKDQGPENGVCRNFNFVPLSKSQSVDKIQVPLNQYSAICLNPYFQRCLLDNRSSQTSSYSVCPRSTLADMKKKAKEEFDKLSPVEKRRLERKKRREQG
jgi:hypothetical protein